MTALLDDARALVKCPLLRTSRHRDDVSTRLNFAHRGGKGAADAIADAAKRSASPVNDISIPAIR